MSETTSTTPDRGISPVIGTVLLIAITVMLASTVAALAMNLEDTVGREVAPTTAFDVEYDPGSGSHDELVVTHTGGDAVEPDRLFVDLSGAECTGGPADPDGRYGLGPDFGETRTVTAGMSYRLDGSSPSTLCSAGTLDLEGASLSVIWVSDEGTSTVLAEWTGPG